MSTRRNRDRTFGSSDPVLLVDDGEGFSSDEVEVGDIVERQNTHIGEAAGISKPQIITFKKITQMGGQSTRVKYGGGDIYRSGITAQDVADLTNDLRQT